MTVHLEAERLIFTGVCVAGLLLRSAFYVSALSDHGFLDRIGASASLKHLVGPWFEIEAGLWIIIAPVFAIGMLSFFSPVQPRTVFGLIATVIFTMLMLTVEFIDFRLWYRRQTNLGSPEARHQAQELQKMNGNHSHGQ
jgi:hypothetical protein